MQFDLILMAAISGGAITVLLTVSATLGRTLGQRFSIGVALALWFAAVLWMGASGFLNGSPLGVIGLGVAVVLPVLALCLVAYGSDFGRRSISKADLFPLILLQTLRVLGVAFLLLYAVRRLPAPFAPTAGWGDIAVGLLALPVSVLYLKQRRVRRYLLAWNVLGIADLVTAVALGTLSSDGPLRLFWQAPGSGIMSSLPWILIPCFLVPCFFFIHIVVFTRATRAQPA